MLRKRRTMSIIPLKLGVLAALAAAAPAACSPPKPQAEVVAMANPASVHCGEIGGRSEIRSDAAGNQSGACRMPDGRVCEEWALFRDGACVAPKD